jgi:hypothetical protein
MKREAVATYSFNYEMKKEKEVEKSDSLFGVCL